MDQLGHGMASLYIVTKYVCGYHEGISQVGYSLKGLKTSVLMHLTHDVKNLLLDVKYSCQIFTKCAVNVNKDYQQKLL